jgi:Leucine-rich repeat (LRR) protein
MMSMWLMPVPVPRFIRHLVIVTFLYLSFNCGPGATGGGGGGVGCWALSSTPVNQTRALQDLYDATNGPHWVFAFGGDPWNFSQPLELTDPCLGWDGIACQCNSNSNSSNSSSGDICNIIGLVKFWSFLEGTVPPTLSMLEHLTVLSLGFNSLTGVIPPELFNLPSLQLLDLGYNSFTGTIPDEVSLLTSIKKFNLFYNLLSGTIPSAIGNWRNLQVW